MPFGSDHFLLYAFVYEATALETQGQANKTTTEHKFYPHWSCSPYLCDGKGFDEYIYQKFVTID